MKKQKTPELQKPMTMISNNVFTHGPIWDAKAIATLQTVADALKNLTELFKSQNIEIGPMLTINSPPVVEQK